MTVQKMAPMVTQLKTLLIHLIARMVIHLTALVVPVETHLE